MTFCIAKLPTFSSMGLVKLKFSFKVEADDLIHFRMLEPNAESYPESKSSQSTFKESKKLLAIEYELCLKLESLTFTTPIEYIYNPLKYAKGLHEAFVIKYFEKSAKKILFLGLNPGPWGMCQNGIAFGERNHVKEWLKVSGSVEKPEKEHPKKKVTGLNCHRSEISGKKFWRFFKTLCGTPENFFKNAFVYNLCPLAFMDVSGKNITPPEIKNKATRDTLNNICDEAFISIIREFKFEVIIGIGKFAEQRAVKALKENGIINVKAFSIPHPSPRNAKNFSNWEEATFMILQEQDVLKYFNVDKNFSTNIFITNKNVSKSQSDQR